MKALLRSTATWVLGTVICIVMVSVAILVQPLDWRHKIIPFLSRVWSRTLLALAGVRLEVQGLEHVTGGRGALVVSNHQGSFDVLAILGSFPSKTVFVSKRENFWIPFIGWHLKVSGYVSLDRSNRRAAMRSLEEAKRAVRRGWLVVIFPEGTRSKDGTVHSFKKGAFATAIDGQLPIVPLVIDGSQSVLSKNGWLVRTGVIRVAFGPPISTEGMTEADRLPLLRRVRDQIIAMHVALGGKGAAPNAPAVASGMQKVA